MLAENLNTMCEVNLDKFCILSEASLAAVKKVTRCCVLRFTRPVDLLMSYFNFALAASAMMVLLLLQSAGSSCSKNDRKKSEMDHRPEQPITSPTPKDLAESQWGGEGISMTIGSDSVKMVFNCASAEIKSVPSTDADGRFKVDGTFTSSRPGPDRIDDPPKPAPAVFAGQMSGDQMTLHIDLKSGESIGDFSLERGKSGPIRRCRLSLMFSKVFFNSLKSDSY